ncbi:Hypothetical_protein [Hexamita inflata]|uniref:Hypothetical_protein n=1 Tax=Hexamita inflata TaxID=28002 RepID=A0AA86PZD6_9EUKA|nr:Hypothetical protein HINF_LOCUS36905 [Hexamita inflata]CAI9952399.1 Hypothetical protein HINF_LOCUS40044 [Hexamita inflata]CAI9963958.1 Hypothetical protein HINF_LOCUS51603 [Hexamita inflata]
MAQTGFIEIFEGKTQALARQCFHLQNRPSFMPTQQRPSRALTESLADKYPTGPFYIFYKYQRWVIYTHLQNVPLLISRGFKDELKHTFQYFRQSIYNTVGVTMAEIEREHHTTDG